MTTHTFDGVTDGYSPRNRGEIAVSPLSPICPDAAPNGAVNVDYEGWQGINMQVGGANAQAFLSLIQRDAANASVCGEGVIAPSGTYPGSTSFYGGVLLPDGRVFCVPYNSTSARIYNPVTDTLTTPSGTYPGLTAFIGGVLLPDGRVFCVPFNSTSARIYNPVTDTLTTPPGTYPGLSAFVGGVLLPDGRVFCVPFSSTSARIAGQRNNFPISMNRTLSPYYNKL